MRRSARRCAASPCNLGHVLTLPAAAVRVAARGAPSRCYRKSRSFAARRPLVRRSGSVPSTPPGRRRQVRASDRLRCWLQFGSPLIHQTKRAARCAAALQVFTLGVGWERPASGGRAPASEEAVRGGSSRRVRRVNWRDGSFRSGSGVIRGSPLRARAPDAGSLRARGPRRSGARGRGRGRRRRPCMRYADGSARGRLLHNQRGHYRGGPFIAGSSGAHAGLRRGGHVEGAGAVARTTP